MKNWDSDTGIKGLIKHGAVVGVIIILGPFMFLVGLKEVAKALITFFTVTYGLSMLENLDQMGIPLPSWIKDHLISTREEAEKVDVKKEIDKAKEKKGDKK